MYIDDFIKTLPTNDKNEVYMGDIDEKVYNVKKSEGLVFCVGFAHPSVFNMRNLDNDSLNKSNESDEKMEIKTDTVEIKKFSIIKFPKTTPPIKSIS